MRPRFVNLLADCHNQRPHGISRRWSSRWLAMTFVMLVMAFVILQSPFASAQGGNLGGFGTLGGVEPGGQYPSQQYYLALEAYRAGDLEQAIDLFDAALRSGRRDINGRWLDSIPALAMLGECYWHLGNLPAAREQVDHVILIVDRVRFLRGVDWASSVQPGAVRSTRSNLWPEARSVQVAPISDKMSYRSGQPLTSAALKNGGTIEEPNIRTMDIAEIMRGIAIASYRRRVLLGPLAENDPMASRLLNATKYPANMQVPLGRIMIGAMRCTGYFSLHDDKKAISDAASTTLFNGGAHPLSAITMLVQTSAIAGTAKPEQAIPVAMNTVHVAAALNQPELIGEAFQLAAGCATPQTAPTVVQAANVVAASMLRESRLAALHCLIAGADAAVTAGDVDAAAAMISNAQSIANRRDVTLPRLTAYGAYVAARMAAARGSSFGVNRVTDLDEATRQMLTFALNHRTRKQSLISMPRVYQLGLIRQAIGTSIGGNTSEKLLKQYCEDPPQEVWTRDAVDGIAGAIVDRSLAHAARVNLAASGGYGDKLLQAADQMLASRFSSQLALGGRISQVRRIAGADERLLDPAIVEFRKKALGPLKEVRTAALAIAQPTPDTIAAAEAKACAAALSRIHLPQVTPPTLDEKLPVAKIPKRTGLLTFISIGNQLYGTLASDGKVAMWTVGGSGRIPGEIGRLLKAIGVGKTRGERLPADESWRENAINLRRHLFPDDATITPDRFDELIIVPDGPLWYLPFELMPLGDIESPLIADKIVVRYAATPGLALKPVAFPPASRAIGVTADQFFAPRDTELNALIVDSIVDVLNDPVRLPETLDTPSGLLTNQVGHLVVAAPRAPNTKNFLLTSVTPYDQATPYGTLDAWMRFPVDVPRTVVLAGFRTPVGAGQMGNGQELFNTLCALNTAGVRSVLISRWAVGGESTAIALREFLQELPFTGMNQSWQRARMVLRDAELDPAAEPLLIQAEHSREGVTGDQPLFWSGYLISSPRHPSASPNSANAN
ncbi:MAG: CHAT domain-containing protein [Rubripirellula sp.]